MRYSNLYSAIRGPIMVIMGLVDIVAWAIGADVIFAVVAAVVVGIILAFATIIDEVRNLWISRVVDRYS